jgi:hypothetical protein
MWLPRWLRNSAFSSACLVCRNGTRHLRPLDGHRTNRTEPLAPSRAFNSNPILVKIEVDPVQPHQLADP